MPPELLGPTGALVAALFGITALARAIVVLWKEHLKADQDDRDQRDKALALLSSSLDGNKANAEANRLMAAAWDQRNRNDVARKRREDA